MKGKRGIVFLVAAVLPLFAWAQDRSVEDLYLQQSAEIQVIRDLSADTSRDMKTIALDYIGEIIDRGNVDDEVRQVLADLTLDGVRNQARLNGRVMNNYPDIRIRAVNYLARIGTPEANSSLIEILTLAVMQVSAAVEEDPSVITAAIKGVSAIGRTDDNGESLRAINAVYVRYNTLKPDNALAMAVVSAIDSFWEKNVRNESNVDVFRSSMDVLGSIQKNYNYIKLVRERAASVIPKLARL
jgi:HEAT repeat protein